jgi:hypothetical protein
MTFDACASTCLDAAKIRAVAGGDFIELLYAGNSREQRCAYDVMRHSVSGASFLPLPSGERVGERGCHGRGAAGLPHPNPSPEGEGLLITSGRNTLIPLPFRGGVRGGAVSHREVGLLNSPASPQRAGFSA